MNWTSKKLIQWRNTLGYGKYKMASFLRVCPHTYAMLEKGKISIKSSDKLDFKYYSWQRRDQIRIYHSKIQRGILRELGLDRLIRKAS